MLELKLEAINIYIFKSWLEIIFVLTQVEGKDFFFKKKGWRLKDGP